MDVCLLCCVLSGRGLCDELITRTEESYRMWSVVVCDLETSWMRRPWLTGGCRAKRKMHSFKTSTKRIHKATSPNRNQDELTAMFSLRLLISLWSSCRLLRRRVDKCSDISEDSTAIRRRNPKIWLSAEHCTNTPSSPLCRPVRHWNTRTQFIVWLGQMANVLSDKERRLNSPSGC
jgi:hypothetical protein